MKLIMDPNLMTAQGVTPVDIRNALTNANVELPTGRIEGNDTEHTIRTVGRIETVEEFNNLIIKESNGSVIRMKDVGVAEMRPENERSLLRGNGAIPTIGVAVSPQPGANYVAIADEFFRRLENIKKDLPSDLKLGMALETTKGIKKAILEVEETIFIVLWTSSTGDIFVFTQLEIHPYTSEDSYTDFVDKCIFYHVFIRLFDQYFNLLGIVLATGLVVDDAIVVLENIYQKIEQGMTPRETAFKGSEEIFFAIVSTTVTLVAVFNCSAMSGE